MKRILLCLPLWMPFGATAATIPETADSVHERLEAGLLSPIERIDRFLGDDRLDDDTDSTRIRLRLGYDYSDLDGLSVNTRVQVRLALPALERRLQIVADSIVESDDTSSPRGVASDAVDSGIDSVVRWIQRIDDRFRVTADVGARISETPQLRFRLRARGIFQICTWELRLTETLTALTDDGYSSTTEKRWSYLADDTWLFRSQSRLVWRDQAYGVEPSQTFSFFSYPRDNRAFEWSLHATWPEAPRTRTARYETGTSYRRLIFRDWLYMNVGGGVDFRQEEGYSANPFARIFCEVIFEE